MNTAEGRFRKELEWSERIKNVDAINFFKADQGHIALLCLAQGISRLQEYVLALEGDIVQ